MSERIVLSLEVTVEKINGVELATAVFNGKKYQVNPVIGMQITEDYGMIGRGSPCPVHDGSISLSVNLQLDHIREKK